MGQSVRLSVELVHDAKFVAEIEGRSIGGQIEFWARLGKAIELVLEGRQSLALQQAGAATPMSELIAAVVSPERRRHVADYFAPKRSRE